MIEHGLVADQLRLIGRRFQRGDDELGVPVGTLEVGTPPKFVQARTWLNAIASQLTQKVIAQR